MKKVHLRVLATAASAILAVAAAGGCASPDDSTAGSGGDTAKAKIPFLMPDIASTRYELFDAPLFKAKIKALCPDCEVLYQNADADASKQQQQANSVLAQGVQAIVIDPVDSAAAATIVQAAKAQRVPVIAYDRPIPQAKADYYVSFDNEKIGALIAQSLVDHLKKENASGGLLQVNGSPTDAAAGLIKKGVHSAVDPSGFPLLAEFDTPGWAPPKAQEWVTGQITKFPGKIAGVVAANDGTGGGSIAAFKAAGVKVPPITGNDAELAAIQRIIAGDQYNTISKPIKIVAEAAANVAYQFVQGNPPAAKTTLFDTPSELFTPTVVTQENVKDLLTGPESPFKTADVCTAAYGVLAAARLAAANQSSGGGDVNLNAIAAAVIGGTSLFGGRGTAFAALLGILVIQSISSGLTLLNLDSSYRFMVTGAVLLLAVTLDSVARRSRKSSGRA